ncbi:MAG: AsmA family protein, partial [Actinomycetota bacterium]
MNWKKIILWSVAVALVLVAGTVITPVLLLKYNHGFRGYLLAKVENAVYSSTGARLQIRDFNLNLSSLSVDLYNVVVHGTETPSQPPLLTADHLNADLAVDSVLQPKWHFQEITIDHPVLHLTVDKSGQNNLPKPKSSNSNTKTNLFDLGIRHFVLDRGAAYFNDRKTPLNADLHNLEVAAQYHPARQKYEGHISYDDGIVRYGHDAAVPHSVNASFSLTPEDFKVDQMTLAVGKSRLVLNATLRNYSSHPEIEA